MSARMSVSWNAVFMQLYVSAKRPYPHRSLLNVFHSSQTDISHADVRRSVGRSVRPAGRPARTPVQVSRNLCNAVRRCLIIIGGPDTFAAASRAELLTAFAKQFVRVCAGNARARPVASCWPPAPPLVDLIHRAPLIRQLGRHHRGTHSEITFPSASLSGFVFSFFFPLPLTRSPLR